MTKYENRAHYVYEYSNGSFRDHVAVWNEATHPYVTNEQWNKMLDGEEVEGTDGSFYGIDDDPVDRW